MISVIIAMPRIEDAKRLADIMRSRGRDVQYVCSTGSEVLSYVGDIDNGIVICGYKLKDMLHTQLLYMLPKGFEMVLTVSAARWDNCAEGVLKVELPVKIAELMRTVDMLLARNEARVKKGGTGSGGRSRQQQDIVEKAQRLLMERNGMERKEAYRYIQKQSMNSGNSMVEVARYILESDYE